jgi:hypothetical protein
MVSPSLRNTNILADYLFSEGLITNYRYTRGKGVSMINKYSERYFKR